MNKKETMFFPPTIYLLQDYGVRTESEMKFQDFQGILFLVIE